MTKALDKEVKKEKEEKRLKRALDEAFPDQKSAPTEVVITFLPRAEARQSVLTSFPQCDDIQTTNGSIQ